LWLKVHASAFEDEPTTAVRRIGEERDFGAVNDAEGEPDAAVSSERRAWNVKSVPRSIAPWSAAAAAAADSSGGRRSK
jgi:hypothetical protein